MPPVPCHPDILEVTEPEEDTSVFETSLEASHDLRSSVDPEGHTRDFEGFDSRDLESSYDTRDTFGREHDTFSVSTSEVFLGIFQLCLIIFLATPPLFLQTYFMECVCLFSHCFTFFRQQQQNIFVWFVDEIFLLCSYISLSSILVV